MKPNLGEWTIVVLGAWDSALVSPQWIGQNFTDDGNLNVGLALTPPGEEVKYALEDAELTVRRGRLIFRSSEASEQAADRCARLAFDLLTKMSVVPVVGLGINFGFTEPHPNDALRTLVSRSTLPPCTVLGDYEPMERSLVWGFADQDGKLNLRVTEKEDGVHFHLNFHFDVAPNQNGADILHGGIAPYLRVALDFLREAFELQLQEADLIDETNDGD